MELHQQAADILLQDAAGCTLLHHAVEVGSKEILKYLIDNGERRLFISSINAECVGGQVTVVQVW